MPSAVCRPCISLSGGGMPKLIRFFVIYIWGWELKWIKNRILLGFIVGPEIQARRHFLTNQIHMITYSFWSLNIFLLISFWAEFSRMFLFCVFSWLVEKYKSVTSMLMQFWSKISWMFLSMFLELIILRLKNCVFYNLWYIYIYIYIYICIMWYFWVTLKCKHKRINFL